MSTIQPPLLEMRAISKHFPGVKALHQVNLVLYPGEVLALMGENGAGKSTLMKVLVGAYQPSEGQIFIDGKAVRMKDPRSARGMGIHLIYQEPNLALNMKVTENIFLGAEKTQWGLLSFQQMRKITQQVLEQVGATFSPDALVGDLSRAEGQLVEIARALAFKPRVLVLDEPTAALSEHESQRLFEIIKHLRGQGLGIVYISHRMSEVYNLADRVSVLRNGVLIGTVQRGPEDPNRSPVDPRRAGINAEKLVQMMLGQSLQEFQKNPQGTPRKPVLELIQVTDGKKIKPTSLTLREGEIVGLGGLVGSGRTELARLICGVSPLKSGKIWLQGNMLDLKSPRDAIQAGMVYVPEDRVNDGLFARLSVSENISIGVLERHSHMGLLNFSEVARQVKNTVTRLNIKLSSLHTTVEDLSGGNQQKLLLARYLSLNPRILLLDEPTAGIDVATRAELYRTLSSLAASGMTILFISSDSAELVQIADRVLVMKEGELVGEIDPARGESITLEHIMEFATGLKGFTPEDWKKRHVL
ncbi:sugar ABC transporter ATP-binding protein [Deinococcus roseus]|uniref:Ribose import ATP-binding protein RbsA n=1 Tax=Deinococcus roseus TaxID=392414 RepID=A0ABQ2D2R5_9DEIO|nr:sugar ABC transporter ATP-binding protein [Deinococcus roseus]GGJ43520.1 ribose import ATP-binding protein RbsA [Deinococcus roseus]